MDKVCRVSFFYNNQYSFPTQVRYGAIVQCGNSSYVVLNEHQVISYVGPWSVDGVEQPPMKFYAANDPQLRQPLIVDIDHLGPRRERVSNVWLVVWGLVAIVLALASWWVCR